MTQSEAGGFKEARYYGVEDSLKSFVLEGFDLDLKEVFRPMS